MKTADSDPHAGSSDKSLLGLATSDPVPPSRPILPVIPARAGPQPPSSGLSLTAARTGAHSSNGNNRPLDTKGSQIRASLL